MTAIARVIAPKSTIAVQGECRAAAPTAAGSTSRSCPPDSRRSPGTRGHGPTLDLAQRGISPALRATTSLPHSSYEPVPGAEVPQQRPSASTQLSLQRARRVVEPGVDDARGPVWWTATSCSLSTTVIGRSGRSWASRWATAKPGSPPRSHRCCAFGRSRQADSRALEDRRAPSRPMSMTASRKAASMCSSVISSRPYSGPVNVERSVPGGMSSRSSPRERCRGR